MYWSVNEGGFGLIVLCQGRSLLAGSEVESYWGPMSGQEEDYFVQTQGTGSEQEVVGYPIWPQGTSTILLNEFRLNCAFRLYVLLTVV
jgi:hypothetical protein